MTDSDAADLAALGHGQALARSFSPLSMLALSFSVLGTWSTCAQNLGTGLKAGGPVIVIWGMIFVGVCNTCVAMSLGELVSSMPTALGQAYWVSRLLGDGKPADAPINVWRWDRLAAYLCAWINTFGWWTLTASQMGFMSDFIIALHKVLASKDRKWVGDAEEPPGGLRLGVYVGITTASTLFIHLASRHPRALPVFNSIVGVWFGLEFFLFSAALPVTVHLKGLQFRTAWWVFTKFRNKTGWSSFMASLIGLVQSAYGLSAFDSVIHMVEELPSPRRNAPRTMCLSVILGSITGLFFLIICLFCLQKDQSQGGKFSFPFINILSTVMGRTAASVLIGLFIANGLGQGASSQVSTSRLTWSFARDGGIPGGQSYFANIDQRWHAPVRALWLQTAIVSVVGLLYLKRDNAVLDALLSVSTIALTLSYCIPIAVLMFVGRDKLPPGGQFNLGPRLGPIVNTISIIYCLVTAAIFFLPTSTNNRNWAYGVFGVMLIVAIGFWMVEGNQRFMTHTTDQDSQLMSAQRSSFGGSATGKKTQTSSTRRQTPRTLGSGDPSVADVDSMQTHALSAETHASSAETHASPTQTRNRSEAQSSLASDEVRAQ